MQVPEQDEPEYWDDEVTEEEWRQFIGWAWRVELADERDDIYTEEDGEPRDEEFPRPDHQVDEGTR